MPGRSISIDAEAYKRLKRAKGPGESFSDVIKRLVHSPVNAKELGDRINAITFSEELAKGALSVRGSTRRSARRAG